jgi:hypothetical protein
MQRGERKKPSTLRQGEEVSDDASVLKVNAAARKG